MGLAIDDDRMFSTDTPHTATRHGDKWVVSWLPGRELSRDEAITAMHLAWYVAVDPSVHGSHWVLIGVAARELDLTREDATKACLKAPEGERADG